LKRKYIILLIVIFTITLSSFAFCEDGIEYRPIPMKDAYSHLAILYKKTQDGMTINVSAIATGKGIDFRKWNIKDLKLNSFGEKIKAEKDENFYVTKESFFRLPAALVFAAIGTQYKQYAYIAQPGHVCPVTSEEAVEKGPIGDTIDKAGMTAGLGLLVSQAKGELTGRKFTFVLDKDMAQKVSTGTVKIELTIENPEKHLKEKTVIPLSRV